MTGIYRITNRRNGRVYIGSSIDIPLRWRDHRSTLRNNKHNNPLLQSDWNTYGEEAFTWEVVQETDEYTLHIAEQQCITAIPHEHRYNILTNTSQRTPKKRTCYKCEEPRLPGQRVCKLHSSQDSLDSYYRNRNKRLKKLAEARETGPKGRQIFEKMQLIFDAVEGNTSECLPWPYTISKAGYGAIMWDGKHYTVHRLSKELTLGRIVGRTRHTCGYATCYNPRHVEEV